MKRLVVIDGKSVFYRGYYAMPNLMTQSGISTGGVYGFASLALELIRKLKPDFVAVAWDKKETNIRRRRELYPAYKAGRKKAPDDFYEQIPILYELLEAFSWPLYELDDYEADDIMGTFARQAEDQGIETCLITSDLDALQLISPLTKVYAMKSGLSHIEEFTPEYFQEKYGITTRQFLDLKALKGDASDNLPGVPGVGEKTAMKLLQTYGDLDTIFMHIDEQRGALKLKLEQGRESAYLTKRVAQIWTDAPVELNWTAAAIKNCHYQKVADILRKLEFSSLVRKLPATMIDTVVPGIAVNSMIVPPVKSLPMNITLAGEIILMFQEDSLYIAPASCGVIYRTKPELTPRSVWRMIEESVVIAKDVKLLYHQLNRVGVEVRFAKLHDIGQAAFLLNPLQHDRSLVALSGDYSGDNSPPHNVLRLQKIYTAQQREFAQHPQLYEIAKQFDFPVIWPLFQMEKRGIALDSCYLKQMQQELHHELARIEQKMYSLVGYQFNPASPLQLSDVLFTKLQLPTIGIKKRKMGYSTGQKELDKLRGRHPIIELIERYRELAKLLSTYVEALPKLTDESGRLHTTFNQDVTSTGRLSSTNPNLQNIPIRTELGRRIRRAFVPSLGKVFVSADYSQFELRLAAVLANDTKLIDDFNSGIDIHTKTAAETYGIRAEEVTKEQRRHAKVINFGILYGMSPHGLAAATGMSFTAAQQFIDHYFQLRHPIREYLDRVLAQAREQGYVETYFGRQRPTPDVKARNFMVRAAAERAAMNMPIQGTEADLMKRAMLRIEDKLTGIGEQILQVHDSILVECLPADMEQVKSILQTEMEHICPELAVKLSVDVSDGTNWGDI